MSTFLKWFVASVIYGTPLLFGTLGEILTEKSGNLNLGVEGIMFMGGAFGLGGVYFYEQLSGRPIYAVGFLIALLCAFLAGAFASMIFSFLTISLRANQNVTGLALAIFGTGAAQFTGDLMRVKANGYVTLSLSFKEKFLASPFPSFLRDIPVVGQLFFSGSLFFYLGLILAALMHLFLKKTRAGLFLRAVGESPSTADAAGINVIRYRYLATIIGGGISAIGGLVYITTTAGGTWNNDCLSGVGWLSVALVIFCLWRPLSAIWGSVLFGALMIMYTRIQVIAFTLFGWRIYIKLPTDLYKILPYIVTIVVLIISSLRNKKEKQPPEGLGLAYFREER